MKFVETYIEFCKGLGIEETDTSGLYSLLIDSKYEVSFRLDAEENSVFLSTPLADNSLFLSQEKLLSLMSEAFSAQKTNNAFFAYDATDKCLNLCKYLPGDYTNAEEFGDKLIDFVNMAALWSSDLNNDTAEVTAKIEETTSLNSTSDNDALDLLKYGMLS